MRTSSGASLKTLVEQSLVFNSLSRNPSKCTMPSDSQFTTITNASLLNRNNSIWLDAWEMSTTSEYCRLLFLVHHGINFNFRRENCHLVLIHWRFGANALYNGHFYPDDSSMVDINDDF